MSATSWDLKLDCTLQGSPAPLHGLEALRWRPCRKTGNLPQLAACTCTAVSHWSCLPKMPVITCTLQVTRPTARSLKLHDGSLAARQGICHSWLQERADFSKYFSCHDGCRLSVDCRGHALDSEIAKLQDGTFAPGQDICHSWLHACAQISNHVSCQSHKQSGIFSVIKCPSS